MRIPMKHWESFVIPLKASNKLNFSDWHSFIVYLNYIYKYSNYKKKYVAILQNFQEYFLYDSESLIRFTVCPELSNFTMNDYL